MSDENRSQIQEMMLAIEANIEYLKKEGDSQIIVRNGQFINDIGELFIYEFTLDFFQDINIESEVEVRVRNYSVNGKVISVDDKKIQLQLDRNIGTNIPEAKLVISSYYLLQLLLDKLKDVESGKIKLTDLSKKTFNLTNSHIGLDEKYQIPYSWISGKPNKFQEEAIRLSLGSEVSFIWGPPGTGKTVTIARIIEGFISKNLSVLLLSHTNMATDGALFNFVHHSEETEDYREGKFIRVGNIQKDDLKNKYPLVRSEAILEKKSLPIRREIDLLEERAKKYQNLIQESERIISMFRKLNKLKEESDSIQNELKKRLEEIKSLEVYINNTRENIKQTDWKIKECQTKGFFGRLFSGLNLDRLSNDKSSLLINLERANDGLVSAKEIIRYGSKKLERIEKGKEDIGGELRNKNFDEYNRSYDENRKLINQIEEQRIALLKQLDELSINLIKEAKVIATTLTKSYSDKLVLNREYDCVIVDEASMAPLPALWCATGLAKEKVVIVGDFYQLPPVVKHKVSREKKTEEEVAMEEMLIKKWLSRDIFKTAGIETAIENGEHPIWLRQLKMQYRMHPDIADVVNELIYKRAGENFKLDSDEITFDRGKQRLNKKPLENLHIGIYDTSSVKSVAHRADSGSYYNLYTALLSVGLARQAVESGYKNIGIVTPFRPQANLIQKILIDSKIDDPVSADTVHKFQGGEKQIIIFDVVTANPTKLTDDKEEGGDDEKILNVAFSRAQEKCIVVADVSGILKKHSQMSLFRRFINYCFEKNITTYSSEDIIERHNVTEKTEKWLEEIYSIKDLEKEIENSKVFSETDFYHSFIKDLLKAKKEIIIDSPYITYERVRILLPVLEQALNRGLNIFILTRQPEEHNESMKLQAEKMIREMEQMGIVILPFKGQIHRKLAIIDREILWEGSLNILSQRDSKEVMRRFVGKETAKQMINFLRLDKNIGKIGENNILRCEYCNKPGSWYWTDRSMYGIWTFCLTGMHKRGAPPKTQKEIKERKKGLTNMRKSEKKKTEDGIPICQNRKVHEEDIPMIKREGRFGEFWGCPKYPRCKNVAKL